MAKQPETAANRPEQGSSGGIGGAARSTNASPALPALSVAAAVFLIMLAAATLPGAAEAYVLRGCYGQTEGAPFDGGSCRYGWEVDACGRHVRKSQEYSELRL